MSAGDTKFDDKPGSIAKLRALMLKYPAIGRRLRRWRQVCNGFDIPYLGGISYNGLYVYIDRHLPKYAEGAKIEIAKYIEVHESVEEALWHISEHEDELKWLHSYEECHHLATAAEEFALLSDGFEYEDYRDALRPDFAPIEHEQIVRVPPDLALYPYSGKLKEHLEVVMKKSRFTKEEVRYREGGKVRHCGNCGMFLPRLRQCTWVEGAIAAEDVCDKFEIKT